MLGYLLLGVLVSVTLWPREGRLTTAYEWRILSFVWVVLGLMALRTWAVYRVKRHEDGPEE